MVDFSEVTELADARVTQPQLARSCQRYFWAGEYCHDKDVLEVACGAGIGLGYLGSISKSIRAGDITPALVAMAQGHYGDRIQITEMNAQSLPHKDSCLDVIILFEAIYYLQSATDFFLECRRVLRPGGCLLLATANCALPDFNPSSFSVRYFDNIKLRDVLSEHGFESEFFGGSPVGLGLKSKILRVFKRAAVKLNLIPSSMKGKTWLKRLVFGRLVPMPKELSAANCNYEAPEKICGENIDSIHQVIYCAARLR